MIKKKKSATTILTQQDSQSPRTNTGNSGTNLPEKHKFQISFEYKYQVLIESEGIDKLAQYLQEPLSQDIDLDLIEYS